MRVTGIIVILVTALAALPCRAETSLKENGKEIGQELAKPVNNLSRGYPWTTS